MKNEIFSSPAFWAIMLALILVPILESTSNDDAVVAQQQAQQETERSRLERQAIIQKQQITINANQNIITKNTIVIPDAGLGGDSKD